MEKKIMSILSIVLSVVMVLCIGLLFFIDDIHGKSEVLAKEMEANREYKLSLANRMRDEQANAAELASFADKGQIRIAYPKSVNTSDITFTEDIINRSMEVVIPRVGDEYFDSDPVLGSALRIDDFYIYDDNGDAYFDIALNDVYTCRTTIEDGYIYLDFQDAHDIFDNVVVIDAGHGSRDVGAVQGNVMEKNIDLEIELKLKELIDQDPTIKAYYTRTSDTNPTLEERVKLANDAEADVFLSIHNNSLSGFGSSTTSGTQVLYYVSDSTGRSKVFADICLDKLCTYLDSVNRGLVNGDDIYIIHNSKSPVALVEIGFMSHAGDLAKLTDDNYQSVCAKALYDSIKEMLSKE